MLVLGIYIIPFIDYYKQCLLFLTWSCVASSELTLPSKEQFVVVGGGHGVYHFATHPVFPVPLSLTYRHVPALPSLRRYNDPGCAEYTVSGDPLPTKMPANADPETDVEITRPSAERMQLTLGRVTVVEAVVIAMPSPSAVLLNVAALSPASDPDCTTFVHVT
jgi:hypothetical protein